MRGRRHGSTGQSSNRLLMTIRKLGLGNAKHGSIACAGCAIPSLPLFDLLRCDMRA
jgi:hypothetical protein